MSKPEKTETIVTTVRLSPETLQALRVYAVSVRQTQGDAVTAALKSYIRENPAPKVGF